MLFFLASHTRIVSLLESKEGPVIATHFVDTGNGHRRIIYSLWVRRVPLVHITQKNVLPPRFQCCSASESGKLYHRLLTDLVGYPSNVAAVAVCDGRLGAQRIRAHPVTMAVAEAGSVGRRAEKLELMGARRCRGFLTLAPGYRFHGGCLKTPLHRGLRHSEFIPDFRCLSFFL